jgi:hypothetical protein
MSTLNYNIDLIDGILVVTAKGKTTLDMLTEAKTLLSNSTGNIYNYGMFKDGLGYYHGYDFIKKYSIYCTTMNRRAAINLVKEYINKQNEE